MELRKLQSRRVIIISDLHLGGAPPAMMSWPRELAGFIQTLPSRRAADEQLELVIGGDFVDFLAIPPFAAWTPDPKEAGRKLDCTMKEQPFAPVFEALGRHVAGGHLLTVLVGNHDVELALPPIQDALLAYLGATPHQVHFVDNNRAYRIGGLLVEHGNRYDGANENDWTGLRAISSALSRGEVPHDVLEASAGSRLVEKIISPLKAAGYPFIVLLQPQGELVALLLVAFEPSLILDLPKVARILRAKQLEEKNAMGLPPGETRHVAFTPTARPDEELRAAFGNVYETLRVPNEQVSLGDLVLTAWRGRKESLSDLLDRGELVPADRLEQIRVAMRKLLLADASDRHDGDTEQYGAAARRMIDSSKGEIEVVAMGHTHLARHIGLSERATYINTGTWADVIRVPATALEKGGEDELQGFLRGLCKSTYRHCPATYADIRVETNGRVSSARLLREPMP